jgi:cytochrome c5
MKRFTILLGFAVTIIIASCSDNSVRAIQVTQKDTDIASKKWQGVTMAQLTQGKTIYESNCNKCHKLKDPKSHTEEEWNKIVPNMSRKAKIDAASQDLVLKYVVTMSIAEK